MVEHLSKPPILEISRYGISKMKGFEKIYLNPGEQKEVTITIDKSALSFFDPVKHDWVAEPGDFEALIGNSSDAIKTKIKFSLQ